MHLAWPPGGAANELGDREIIDLYKPARRAERLLRVNFVTSVDGACTVEGRSGGLSNSADKRVFDLLRMLSDVLIVGAGTFRDEGYLDLRLSPTASAWRRDHGLREHPVLALVSHRLALEPDHPAFTQAPRRPIVITRAASPAAQRRRLAAHTDVLCCGDDAVDLRLALKTLEDRGLTQMLCEGGPHLLGSLLAEDLVDELCLTFSPTAAGPGASRIVAGSPSRVQRIKLGHLLIDGDTVLARYVCHN